MILLPSKILALTTNLAIFSSEKTIFTVGFKPQQLHGAFKHLFTRSSKSLNWLLQEVTNLPPYYDSLIMTELCTHYHRILPPLKY